MPRLVYDNAATWQLSLKLDTSAAIEGLTSAANQRKHLNFENSSFPLTHPCLTPPLEGIPLEFLDEIYYAKTRGMKLLYGENCILLTSTIFD